MFCVFLGKSRDIFSAVKTEWRSEWDSNLHYPFCLDTKSPCVRNMQRILQLTRPSGEWRTREFGKVVLFPYSTEG